MTRAEAIKVLQSKLHLDCSVSMAIKELEAREVAITALREQEQSQWISVKERLPEDKKDEYVLVVCDYHGKISVETRKKWNLDSSVTHWMPLPEPPKED